MVDTDVDVFTCDYCGVEIDPSSEESAFRAFTSHFEEEHAADAFGSTAATQAERGAGD